MTLCPADPVLGLPWGAPVVFWTCQHDKLCHLYFVSHPDSKHCQHIEKNPGVAACIYDSTAWDHQGKGYQILGLCSRVTETSDFRQALAAAAVQRFPLEDPEKVFSYASATWPKLGKCLYAIRVQEVWTNDLKNGVDVRRLLNVTSMAQIKNQFGPLRPHGKL